MKTTTASPVRTGQAFPDGNGRKSLRAPKGPRAERAIRRGFTADYKLAVLAEYDRCSEPGERVPCCAGRACTPRSSPTGAVNTARAPWW